MKNKGYSFTMKVTLERYFCYIKKMVMPLISKKYLPLRVFITLLIVIVCCSFEFSFAENSTDTSNSHKDSTDVSELLEESKATEDIIEESAAPSESHKDSTDVSELLKESKVALDLPVDANDISELPKNSQDVSELLEESKKRVPRQWFEDEVIMRALRPYARAKKHLHDEYRIDTATEQVFVYQRATGNRRPREHSAYNFTFFGQWHISKDKQKDLGVIGFSFEERDNISDYSVGDFSSEVGSSFKTHDLQTKERSRTALREVWWRKKYDDDKVTLTLGKIHHSSYYNRNNFAGNARTFFTSRAFSRNINRMSPADGLGANLKVNSEDDFYVSLGFGDVRAENKTSGFDTFGDGDFFSAVELGLTPKIPGKGQGNYRFTLWHIDETELVKEGYGFALSFDQELGKKFGVFARYGYTEPQSTSVEHYLSGGFVVRNPWGIKGDMLGVGVSWDQASDTKEDEFAVEVFHRIQATRLIQVTPSILIIFDPVRSNKTDPVAVFGLRTRLLF
jgi:porin